jgi:hypothetical protein
MMGGGGGVGQINDLEKGDRDSNCDRWNGMFSHVRITKVEKGRMKEEKGKGQAVS